MMISRSLGTALLALVGLLTPRTGTAQNVAVAQDTVITLQRTSCYGECPVYTVTIDARGNVAYDGTAFVWLDGRHTDRIPVSQVAAILETADRIHFSELRDRYLTIETPDGTVSVSDQPTTGARLDEPDDTGRASLWLASCGANVSVVTVLLAAGADPRGGTSQMSALDCTRQARDEERRRTPLILEGKRPAIQDFDRIIILLEQAAERPRR